MDLVDELKTWLDSQGEAPEAVAPSVHHNTEFDFVAQPVVSPLPSASPYPPGHEPEPAQDGAGGLSAAPTQRPNLLAKVRRWFRRGEALPAPGHSLNWSGPGSPGKGLYYNDTGQVFTWDVHGPERSPHHSEMHPEFRPDLRLNEQQLLAGGHVPFNISPAGIIANSWSEDGQIDPYQASAITDADPRLRPGDTNDAYGFGHGRGVLDRLEGYYSSDDNPDELHYALQIPEHIRDRIKEWVDEQDWPEDTELEDPDDYHITLLYSADGHDDHHDADWLYPTEGYDVKITHVDEFGEGAKKAIVLRIESDDALEHANDLLDAAENKGLEISRFPGGYKPHFTVAYGFGKPPYARAPKLRFKTGPASVSEPRTAAIRGMGRPPQHIHPHVHYHPYTGLPCTCPWGQPADNKALHPFFRQAGSQNVRKIRNQNQKIFRDEYGQNYLNALNQLVEYHPDIEGMVPWIASRVKHGDIAYHPERQELVGAPTLHTTLALDGSQQKPGDVAREIMETPTHSMRGYFSPIATSVPGWAQWYNARQHPTRRGVVFDKMDVEDLESRVRTFKADMEEKRKKERWLSNYGGYAPIAHRFEGGPQHGWTVNQLHNVDDCEAESQAMGHCIGDSGQKYRGNIDAGNIDAFSLRDSEGYPHATWHYNPDGSLAHIQGRSGGISEDYRNAISAFADESGRPDEEVGEHELEDLERQPCPECDYGLDEYGDCENCGYPHPCPSCGEHGYDEEEGCNHCDHNVDRCPQCNARGEDPDEYHPCRECGYPHDSEINLPSPDTVDDYYQQYHPLHQDLNSLAQHEGNPGEDTVIQTGRPDWESIFQDAAGLRPQDQQHLFDTIHGHQQHDEFEDEAVQKYLNHPNPDAWHNDDENNVVDQWRRNQQRHFNPQTQQFEAPQYDWGQNRWTTAQDKWMPQMWNEPQVRSPATLRGDELDYSPAQEGGWELPQPQGYQSSITNDPYICQSCLKPALSEPKQVPGDWRWSQTCTNCGRTTSISPTHPVVQQIKNMQPQYPDLLTQVAQPRPLGEWMSHNNACTRCGRDVGQGVCGFDPVTQGILCMTCWAEDHPQGLPAHPNLGFDIGPHDLGEPKYGMAADPDWWAQHSQTNPYVYHSGPREALENVRQHGLLPWDHPQNTSGSEWEGKVTEPRSGHIYMNVDQPQAYGGIQYRVPAHALDPAHINPDEDDMSRDFEGHQGPGSPSGWLADYYGWGDDPQHTQNAIENRSGNLAYQGVIPPEHIEYRFPARDHWLDPNAGADEGWQPVVSSGE